MGLALQLAPALLSMAMYAARARTLASTPRAVARWRQACFHAGALIAAVSVVALGDLAQERFWAHMVEHLLLVDVAALLLVLGLTGPVLAPVLRLPALRPLRALGHPAVALPLWIANLALWHVPGPHEAAVTHEALHALQHLLFLGTGGAVWMALLGPLPKPEWFGNAARLGYIVGVRLAGAALANALLFGGEPFYDVYTAPDPEEDQIVAASLMMVEESVLTICLLAWLFLRAARESDERQELLDLAARRGVTLTAERAARAVAAGRGEELRRRIGASEPGT
ncbi:MAG TPA: cytochrome c oxidase assembly protein [Baekduia sp.]|nr:cytochrome c oxidase assembly protein [Baekduia sp.]